MRFLQCKSYSTRLGRGEIQAHIQHVRSICFYSMASILYFLPGPMSIQKVQAYEQQAKIGLQHLLKIHATGLKFTKTQILLAS